MWNSTSKYLRTNIENKRWQSPYRLVSSKELFVADLPLVINRASKTHLICRNLYKTYKTVGFVPGSNFFLTFCTTQDENQSAVHNASGKEDTIILYWVIFNRMSNNGIWIQQMSLYKICWCYSQLKLVIKTINCYNKTIGNILFIKNVSV